MITMNNIPLAIIFVVGAVLLLILPRRVRPAAYLAIPVLAFYFLLHLEPGAILKIPFLSYELVPCRVDGLSLVFGYVFVIMGFLGVFIAFI